MWRLFKALMIVALILGGLSFASYVASRAAVGKILGSNPSFMGNRSISFAFEGAEDVDENPRVWVYHFKPTSLPGVAEAYVYVTITGEVVRTRPRNLAERIERYRDREP